MSALKLLLPLLLISVAEAASNLPLQCERVSQIGLKDALVFKSSFEQVLAYTADGVSCVLTALLRSVQAPLIVQLDARSGTCKRLGQPLFANYSPAVHQQGPSFYASSRIGQPRLALFSIKAGSRVNVRSLYSTVSADCGAGGFLALWPDAAPQTDSYRSCWLDRLAQLSDLAELMPLRRLVVELLASSGARLLRIEFDASFGSGWFSKEAVLGSEPELSLKTRGYNFFSIDGFTLPDLRVDRSFYISTSHNGCDHDTGLLSVIENTTEVCPWARVGASPALIYNLAVGEWQSNTMSAGYFIIYIT